jgi:hypothetical protein
MFRSENTILKNQMPLTDEKGNSRHRKTETAPVLRPFELIIVYR